MDHWASHSVPTQLDRTPRWVARLAGPRALLGRALSWAACFVGPPTLPGRATAGPASAGPLLNWAATMDQPPSLLLLQMDRFCWHHWASSNAGPRPAQLGHAPPWAADHSRSTTHWAPPFEPGPLTTCLFRWAALSQSMSGHSLLLLGLARRWACAALGLAILLNTGRTTARLGRHLLDRPTNAQVRFAHTKYYTTNHHHTRLNYISQPPPENSQPPAPSRWARRAVTGRLPENSTV
ncbi:hypothetical protein Salat_2958800 [Sesamum alatum]|uniref:Uncharacterized protein n=1 Tax=Sesamum alatum TaxID=300844 RepID=A0AAE1XKH9_9LAMI|nr:hypothetical protein Salat_2958800 [Sesamum alatum]